jgi:hypothetical protein
MKQGRYLKLRPIHSHVNPMIVRPPLKVLLMVCIVNSMVELLVDLWQSEEQNKVNFKQILGTNYKMQFKF